MSSTALRKIWTFLGVLSFGFALTSFLRTTGADVSDYVLPLGKTDPFAAALVSWPLLAALLGVLLHVTRLYGNRVETASWYARLPIFFFDSSEVEVESELGRRYQIVMAFFLLALPLALQSLILLKVFYGTAYTPTTDFATRWGHFWPAARVNWVDALNGQYRLGNQYTSGVTYYPYVSAYLYGLFEMALLAYAVDTFRALVKRPSAHRSHKSVR